MVIKASALKRAPKLAVVKSLKLDLGTGSPSKRDPSYQGFIGVDIRKGEGVDIVHDLRLPWPWKDDSVDEALGAHLIEYFKPLERVHFVNELYRVLKPGAKATLWTPHWCSNRAYGDLMREWPPVSEDWANFLNKAWRDGNYPNGGGQPYTCDFDTTIGYAMHPGLNGRNQDFIVNALTFSKEAAQDLILTTIKTIR